MHFMGKNSDIFIALIGIVASSLSCLFAYNNILESENAANILSNSLKFGSSNYQVKQNDACIGEINTQLKKDKDYYLESKISLNLSFREQPLDSHININATFNPLGQMLNSSINIDSPILCLALSSNQINPILYNLAVRSGFNLECDKKAGITDKVYKTSGSLVGPVTIKENATLVSISAPGLRQAKQMTFSPLASSIHDSMQLSVAEAQSDCSSARLDLAPLVELLKSQLKFFNFLGLLQPKGENN